MRYLSRVATGAVIASLPIVASCARSHPVSTPAGTSTSTHLRDLDTLPGLPLPTTRSLRFTATEGTWMSVDVSPDGRTIVFDLLGDLYTLPIAGGQATRITDGPALDAQPRFAPDGKTIAFTSDRNGAENLWTIAPDGTAPHQISNEREHLFQSPAWTPAGDSIVVVRRLAAGTLAGHLQIYARQGGTGRLATGDSIGPNAVNDMWMGPTFNRDARFLWHTRFEQDRGVSGRSLTQHQIAIYDRVAKRDSVLPRPPGGAMRPILSPDGRWLVFGTRRGERTALVLRDRNAGTDTVLVAEMTQSVPYADETRDAMPSSAFTPDGKALVITNQGKFWRVAIPSGEVTPIPFTAEVDQRLGPLVRFTFPIDDSVYTVRQIRDARFSPDGKRLAFTAIDRLWVMAWPNGTPTRLTHRESGERHPVWSPDGRHIAFVSWEDTTQGVYRVPADGGPVERLTTEPGLYRRPNYTPDGRRIIVSRAPVPPLGTNTTIRSGQFVLAWLPASGGATTAIGDQRRWDKDNLPYVLRRDTTRVYHGGHSLGWTGNAPRDDVDDQYYRAVLSPDGRYALFDGVDEDVALVPLAGVDSVISIRVPTARHVTRIGGDFAGWSDDGRFLYYTRGATVVRMPVACVDTAGPVAGGFLDDVCQTETRDIEIELAPDRALGTVVLRGGTLITMRDDQVIANGDVLVRNGRIADVGPRGSVKIPADAHVVDVSGKVVMPGLIDVHEHGRNWTLDHMRTYLLPLAFGVIAQRDPQSPTESFGDADEQAVGSLLAPRLFPTGPGIGSSNWSEEQRAEYWGNTMRTPRRAMDVIERYVRYGRVTQLKEYMIGDRRARQWFNMAARELGASATCEGGRADLKGAMARMLDGYAGHEHFFVVAPLYDDMIRLIAASGIVYTPTLGAYAHEGPAAFAYYRDDYDVANDPRLSHLMPSTSTGAVQSAGPEPAFVEYARQLPRIEAAGGKLAMGAHGSGAGLDVHFEIWAMASGGLSPHKALRAATLGGAEAIGRERDLGSLERGKLADLIVLDGNPLGDIRQSITVHYVMQGGRLYESTTLNELWPRQRPVPRVWWLAN